ncbi:RING-H2 finger protein ATL18-like [Argentina anserina]|uniref:RING-H2 finger protein ATL18-like n=1 Tax=Argentina anserina TaxID=57926 RepID=UPI0021764111|nr:RING-H2 finger protein ATL18-like [Potentilla anserina]
MIWLMVSQSGLTMATIFFYTCFWIPFMQLKKALAGIISDILYFTDIYKPEDHACCNVDQLSLPVARFQDLQGHSSTERSERVAETCSVCLVEFEDEDVVSQLSKCTHVFHVDCLEKWMERNHFTCPLCRSLFFNVNTCHVKCDDDFLPHSWQY